MNPAGGVPAERRVYRLRELAELLRDAESPAALLQTAPYPCQYIEVQLWKDLSAENIHE